MTYENAVAALAATADWHKASFSDDDQNGCVEVGTASGVVGVRDTKLGPASPILAFTEAEWSAFVAGVKDSEFDR